MSRKRPYEVSDPAQHSGQVHKKRRHDYSEDDAQLARIYEQLSDDHPKERVAAVKLLKAFISERPAERPIGVISARLIRGLCSARKASRAGFYNALVELLWDTSQKADASQLLDRLLEQIENETTPPKAASNAERHQHSLGRLAAYHALVTSELVFLNGISLQQLRLFLSRTIDLGSAAAPLLEGCGKLWVDFVRAAAAHKSYDEISAILNMLNTAKKLKTPEGVAVWLACSPLMRKIKHVPVIWPDRDPFMAVPDLLQGLVRVLPSDERSEGELDQSGYAQRAPHFVWEALIRNTARQDEKSDTADSASVRAPNLSSHARAFWKSAFDDIFFEPKATDERKAIGLKVFMQATMVMPDGRLDIFLTRNLLQCLLNQLTSPDRYLHEAAHDVLDRLKDRLSDKDLPTTLSELLRKLFWVDEKHATIDLAFSRKTGPLVEALIKAGSYNNLENAWTLIVRLLEVQGSAHTAVKVTGQIGIVLDHLVTAHDAALNHAENQAGNLSGRIATFLIPYALKIPGSSPVSDRERSRPFAEQAQTRMWSLVKQLVVKKEYAALVDAARKLQDVPVEETWLLEGGSQGIPISISSFFELRLPALTKCILEGPDEDQAKDKSDAMRETEALVPLWTTLLFMAYAGREDGVGLLEDLEEAYASDSKSRDGYVHIIMTLTSMEEGVFRLVAEQAFAAFSDRTSSDGLQPLFDIIAQQENAAGQRELFEQQDEIKDEDSEGSKDQDSDVEVINGNANSEDAAPSDSNSADNNQGDSPASASDDDDSDDDENNADANDEALNASLGRILQTQGLDTNGDLDIEAPQSDTSDSDSDADMTDSEMERLNIDDQLSSIFKQRAGNSQGKDKPNAAEDKKKQQKESKRLVVTFKTRVLSLLSIYVQARYASRDCLSVLVPLCQLIGATRDAHLGKKAAELLERYISLCKKKPDGLPLRAKKEMLWQVLDEVHEEVLLWRGKQHLSACSRASIFLARVLFEKSKGSKHDGRGTKNTVNRLRQRYEATKERKAELKSELPNTFWENFGGWLKSMRLE